MWGIADISGGLFLCNSISLHKMKKEMETTAPPVSGIRMPAGDRDNPEKQKALRRFAIQTITGITMLRYEDVLLFEYQKNMRKWQVRLTGDKVYSLRSTVTSAGITSLAQSFVQINQFCIINLSHLLGIENKTLKCIFDVPADTDIDRRISPLYYRRIRTLLDIL
jgi:DNA-binding LytR/AlgR family response regulator